MKNYSFCIFSLVIFALTTSCEKEYQRPQKYEIDLFADEKRDTLKPYMMSEDVAYGVSDMVVASSDISVSDSSLSRGKGLFIYSINSGDLLFSKRDSMISYPFYFFSNQRLDLKKEKNDSIYVFLETMKGYKIVAETTKIKYQWLRGAPVYLLDNAKK